MRRGLGTTVALIAAFACITGVAGADTIKPTRFDDPVPNGCKPGDCSLREAIVAANKTDRADTVKLRKGRYRLAVPEDGDDDGKSGDLDLVERITVAGKGPKRTTVDGKGIGPVFQLLTFPTHALKSMTIKGGSSDGDGGGVQITPAKAVLTNLVIKKNEAADCGGGISSISENLKIRRTTVTKNAAPRGGGVCTHSGIITNPAGVISATTISGNTAGSGGGLAVDGSNPGSYDEDPSIEIVNSTIAGNSSTGNGGGLYAIEGGGLAVDNATVSYNQANSDATGGGAGGGMFQATAAPVAFDDSIIAENTVGSGGSSPECAGTFTGSASLIGGSTAGCTIGATNTINAFISPFANNGGPTKTVAIEEPSQANGLAGDCPAKDQRGVKRANDCDSGSFELRGQP